MIDYKKCKTLEELGNPPEIWSDEYYKRMEEILREECEEDGENRLEY